MSIPNLFAVPGWSLPSDIKIEKDPKKDKSNENITKPSENAKAEAKLNTDNTNNNKREIEEVEAQSTNNITNKKKKKNKNKKKNKVNNEVEENNLVNVPFTDKTQDQTPAKLNEEVEKNKEKKLVSKEKNKKNKHLLKEILKSKKEEPAIQEEDSVEEAEAENQPTLATKGQSSTKNLTPLQQKMQKQLAGAKFRQLNELLYTIPSADAYTQFQNNPQLFDDYHLGFSSQTEGWPLNPNDVFINFLKSQKSDRTLFVADMGCGEAKIAQNLQNYKHIKINSFDLVKGNKFITPCDIRNVPLKNKTCDFVIFSLSLMGVNYFEFLKEAKRLLRQNGELKIAEVKSRFENLEKFIEFMKLYFGFELVNMDESNKMFVLMDFKINTKLKTNSKLAPPKLKPCIYKRR